MEICGAVDLGNGIHWIGICDTINELHCNPYIIIDNDEAVLIDPGSAIDFNHVLENVKSLVPIENIRHFILHHQDPDLCSAVPLFERHGLNALAVTHWRTSLMVKYYGMSSDFYIVNENDNILTLSSGRTLEFIHTPYLHFPGAIVTFDHQSGTLFSSDLFGAISGHWELFADERYMEVMKSFHEHYVPGNELIRPIMEIFLQMPIKMICPQHGSIIQNNIKDYIIALRDLECGVFLNPIKKHLFQSGGYAGVSNVILKRLISTYGKEAVYNTFRDSSFSLDPDTGLIKDFSIKGEDIWQEVFSRIYSAGGIRWLTVIEPLVKKIVKEYDIQLPSIYGAATIDEQRRSEKLEEEIKSLRSINEQLKDNIELTNNRLIKDSTTELYNQRFFEPYLANLLRNKSGRNLAVLFVSVDDMKQINTDYGEESGDEVLKSVAYLLLNEKEDNHYVFRLGGPLFAYLIVLKTDEEPVEEAERIRTSIESSKIFLQKITASVGIVRIENTKRTKQDPEEIVEHTIVYGRSAVENARLLGGNRVSSETRIREEDVKTGRVLIMEFDEFHAHMLQDAFHTISIETLICTKGSQTLGMVASFHPDVIVSELFLPQGDVFQIREQLLENTTTKDIPFIIVSHQKDEHTVVRALDLNITHFYKKPYIMAELLGVVDILVRKRRWGHAH